MSVHSGLDVLIEGFSFVTAEDVELAAETPVEDRVVYETNRRDQSVIVRVEGDMTGLEVRVEPIAAGQRVLGTAASGDTGVAGAVTFRRAGAAELVRGVTGAGVELPVRYTVVALDPEARSRVGDIRISYSIH